MVNELENFRPLWDEFDGELFQDLVCDLLTEEGYLVEPSGIGPDGGIDIFAPEGINVVTRVQCMFGGMDNKMPSSNSPDSPTLIVDGLILFGGADIKLKRTFKERLHDFAYGLKDMFSMNNKYDSF